MIHVSGAVYEVVVRKARLSIVPVKQDFLDAIQTLRYYLGVTEHHPKFDRFDYRQKFEYWGLILGAVIVIATGHRPAVAGGSSRRFLPGEVIPAAKVAHSNEGLMAFLVVVTWHIYNAHFNPDVFPFDTTIFTGRITRERMEHEHPYELERLVRHGNGIWTGPRSWSGSLTSSSRPRCTASSPRSPSSC